MFGNNANAPKPAHQRVTVRHAHIGDADGLTRLAALDGAHVPDLPALVAESDFRLLAALPLGSGRPIADPFEPTAELVALLELRAAQLQRGDPQRRRSLRRLLRSRRQLPVRQGSA